MQLTWTEFPDTETPIATYEVAIGSQPGWTDIDPYRAVGLVTQVFLDDLWLEPGTQVCLLNQWKDSHSFNRLNYKAKYLFIAGT